MSNTLALAANTDLRNDSGSSKIVRSKTEGIVLCAALIYVCILIVAGNLLTIVLFAVNKRIHKKSLFLVINMAFADLMLGAVTLPIYIYLVGGNFHVWTDQPGGLWDSESFSNLHIIVDTAFSQASLISAVFISCERFYAIYWPFKHRTLSSRAYRIVMSTVWILALFISALQWTGLSKLISYKHAFYIWTPYILILTFIVCGCNIGIWRKFQHRSVASRQQHRNSVNKRLTKTLLFVSALALLSWFPLIVTNFLIVVCHVSVPRKFYHMVNILNYSNSFVNPMVYAFRIPESRQASSLCCFRNQATRNLEHIN